MAHYKSDLEIISVSFFGIEKQI